ncbi:hypothetical protein [Paraburkholderia sp. GAS32]|uniref:hypothetical protein n=1 Tax=Paraburkholderia sp. GAS32 TaxID=3035129 RepID=UPI003D195F52
MKKEATDIINACSNLVAQLDAHPTGGAIFVCCLAMVMLVVVVVRLSGPRPPRSS